MAEAQQTLETRTKKENRRLVSFVKRKTGCDINIFPFIEKLAELVESDQKLLEVVIGAVSAAYHYGEAGRPIDYKSLNYILGYLPGSLPNAELNKFLEAIYKSVKPKKYFS